MSHHRFTVIGARGFIGSRLVEDLRLQGHDCVGLDRRDAIPRDETLGHVLYCAGVTADFRVRPYDTVRAHVCLLADLLEESRFESLLYLSSARVYAGADSTSEEASLSVAPTDPNRYYDLTKLAGESLCLASGREGVRIARLANVFGDDFHSDNFMTSVLRDAIRTGHVTLQTSLDSEKDYVDIEDVVQVIPKIALGGRHRLYNVASGSNTSNRTILEVLSRQVGCTYEEQGSPPVTRFPTIDIGRLGGEFEWAPRCLVDGLPRLVNAYRRFLHD